jgi:small subunit ribosomal protein S16
MLKIRLRRMGNRNRPFYRVVVSDSRRRPTSTTVEEVGFYDSLKTPAVVELKHDRIQFWVDNGAQLSHTVAKLLAATPQAAPAES